VSSETAGNGGLQAGGCRDYSRPATTTTVGRWRWRLQHRCGLPQASGGGDSRRRAAAGTEAAVASRDYSRRGRPQLQRIAHISSQIPPRPDLHSKAKRPKIPSSPSPKIPLRPTLIEPNWAAMANPRASAGWNWRAVPPNRAPGDWMASHEAPVNHRLATQRLQQKVPGAAAVAVL
jgi:hypothetical protein